MAMPVRQEVKSAIVELQHELAERISGKALRMVPERNLHITLHFLGNQPSAGPIVEALESIRHDPVDLEVRGCGYFPSVRRPRVFWVGITDASGGLAEIHEHLARSLEARSLPVERRPFRPHITVAYVRKGVRPHEIRSLAEATRPMVDESIGHFRADVIELLNSRMGPGGSVYSEVAHVRLAENG